MMRGSASCSVSGVIPDSFNVIFGRIKEITGSRTQVELAEILGIRQSSISDAKKRESVPSDWYLKLFEIYGVNPLWIKAGHEPQFFLPGVGINSRALVAGINQMETVKLFKMLIERLAPEDIVEEVRQTMSLKYLVVEPEDTLRGLLFKIMPGELARRYFDRLFINMPQVEKEKQMPTITKLLQGTEKIVSPLLPHSPVGTTGDIVIRRRQFQPAHEDAEEK